MKPERSTASGRLGRGLLAGAAAMLVLLAGGRSLAGPAAAALSVRTHESEQDAVVTNSRCPVLPEEEIDPEIFIEYRGKREVTGT